MRFTIRINIKNKKKKTDQPNFHDKKMYKIASFVSFKNNISMN